ncbi:MAG: tetratricopeptide repeat protein [Candidatus Contendobacter sp.]|nr:tetratricopeptide repeat protein [Candidatus Contendobacter sp.]
MPQQNSVTFSASPQDQALLLWLKSEIDSGNSHLRQGNPEEAIAAFQRALAKAPPHLAAYDVITHNLMTAYKQYIELLLQTNDFDTTNRHLPDVFALRLRGEMAGDMEFRGRFADVYYDLGKIFYRARQHEAALACVRRAIAIQPCPSYYVDLTNALGFVKTRARLADYTQDYPPEQLGRHLFIACAPKSGSTFLKNVLVKLTQFKDLFCTYAALQNEHELDLPQLAKFGRVNKVTQQHCRATEANIQLMQAFGIRPVILVRNIFDTVMSLLDFYKGGFTFSTFFDRADFDRFSDEERIDLLIEYAVPWYFQFVVSWQRAEREGRLSLCWLNYETMISDKPGTVERLLTFYGIAAPRQAIETIISASEADPRGNRFNQGIAGRGQSGLSAAQRERIIGLARFFPKADFGCLGF